MGVKVTSGDEEDPDEESEENEADSESNCTVERIYDDYRGWLGMLRREIDTQATMVDV